MVVAHAQWVRLCDNFIDHCASYEVLALSASGSGQISTLSGVILAGGRSRRMGRDKALTPVPETGLTMLESVFEALSTITTDIVIVAPRRAGYERCGVPVIGDAPGPSGPLRAISTGINAVAGDRCIVIACDLPYVNPRLLAWMAGLETDADALVPVTHGTSRQGGTEVFQTLHAIYRKSCLPAIEQCLRRGDPRTTSFLDRVQVQTIPEASLRSIDPSLKSFLNINTPGDWFGQ